MYKTIDLFAGAGGLSLGFKQTGKYKILAAAEIQDSARNTYKKNIPDSSDNFVFIDNVVGYDFKKLNQISMWEASDYTEDEIITYLEKNYMTLNDLVQIPEASFAKLKHAHQRKVEFSRFLDDHRAEPYFVCRLKFLFGIKR